MDEPFLEDQAMMPSSTESSPILPTAETSVESFLEPSAKSSTKFSTESRPEHSAESIPEPPSAASLTEPKGEWLPESSAELLSEHSAKPLPECSVESPMVYLVKLLPECSTESPKKSLIECLPKPSAESSREFTIKWPKKFSTESSTAPTTRLLSKHSTESPTDLSVESSEKPSLDPKLEPLPTPPMTPYAEMPTSIIYPPVIAMFAPHIKLPFLSERPMFGFYSDTDVAPNPHDTKLPRFDDADEPVLYQDFLGGGQEGYVFAASIKGKPYAVKVFKPFHPHGPPQFTLEDRIKYLSPFANECRAFARIHQFHQDGQFSPKCYGWMKVTRTSLTKFRIERDSLSHYAIVKELIHEDTKPEHISHIQDGLVSFHEMGITVVDVSPENYKGSRLVDFGNASTWPHRTWSRFCHEISLECSIDQITRWTWKDSRMIEFEEN